MKFTVVSLLFTFSIALVFANSNPLKPADKDEESFKECNAIIPVQRNPRSTIITSIATGASINLTQEEKCHLCCLLEKVKFLDTNHNIHGPGLVKYTLKHSPQLLKYVDVLIALIYQTNRAPKDFEDQCQKCFYRFYTYTTGAFVLGIAGGLENYTDVTSKMQNSISTGKDLGEKFGQELRKYFAYYESLVTPLAREVQQQDQIETAQSQGLNVTSQEASTSPPQAKAKAKA